MANEAGGAAGPVVESFAPLSGRVLGYAATGAGVLLVFGSLLSDPTTNRGLILFAVAMILVAWVALLRPLVVAHTNGVVLRNMVSDTFIPWSCVQRVRVLQTLQVVTPTKVYHGLGVSRSANAMMRESRQRHASPGFFGVGGGGITGFDPAETGSSTGQHVGGSYQGYVESRLQEFASGSPDPSSAEPVVSLAVPPLAALAVAAVCIAFIIL